MANTIQLTVSEESIDANNNVITAEDYTLTNTYTEQTKGTKIVANGASSESLNMGGVTTADYMRLNTDQTITVFINGIATGITVTDQVIFNGTSITQIDISNASGSNANIDFDFRS